MHFHVKVSVISGFCSCVPRHFRNPDQLRPQTSYVWFGQTTRCHCGLKTLSSMSKL